jgi:hypothetical protein
VLSATVQTPIEASQALLEGLQALEDADVLNHGRANGLARKVADGALTAEQAQPLFDAGDTTWGQEYATVTIVFDLPPAMAAQLRTEVQGGVGNLANGATIHVPAGITLVMRAKENGWRTDWFSVPVEAGDGTITWGLGPVYAQ